MAFDHHSCHCRPSTTAAAAAPTLCFCCSIHPAYYHPPPPPSDPHSMPPYFHDPQQQPHFFNPYPNSPYNSQTLLHQHRRRLQPQELHHHCQAQQVDTHPVVSSLLRRIAALEASLRRRSVSSHSLRDTAARTIQTYFRDFLVRRSRALRELKELASIKSSFNILKSSASDSNPQAVYHKAKHLLLRLDAIQGSDPMIRDGKKSIGRELIKLMELIDVTSAESYGRPSRIANKSRVQILQDMEKMESIINSYIELRKSVQEDDEFESPRVSVIKKTRKGGLAKRQSEVESKVNKVVTFADDDHVFRASQMNHLKPIAEANKELVESLCRRVEDLGVALKEVEVDEEAQLEDVGGSQGSSDDETEPNCSSINEGKFERRVDHGENGSFFFSAPLPAKMEGRADFINRSNTVRFAS